jgi:diguanylate cyclase (GGDEF)-like protein
VLGGLPHYVSIFVLDGEARRVLGVGGIPALAPEALQRLAAVEDVALSSVLRDREGRGFQAVTSAVHGPGGRRIFTLHALLPLSAVEQVLVAAGRSGAARILVFDEGGGFVAASAGISPEGRVPRPALQAAEPGSVLDYVAGDRLRVVGSTLPFERLGWSLVVEEDYDAAFAPIASILSRTVASNLGIVLVLSGIAFGVGARLVRPLHALSDCARRLRDGEERVELPVVSSADEVGILARTFAEMVHSLKRANESLEQLAITDGLTKVHNHRYFQDQLAKEIRRSHRTGDPLALVLVDVDDFKALNDRHGHLVGDAVLEALAALLVEQTRDHDLVARYGGEEFAVLAPATDRDGALALAEKIRLAAASATFRIPSAGDLVGLTVSVGVANYHGDARALFQDADRALYAAKASGKDCVVVAEEVARS